MEAQDSSVGSRQRFLVAGLGGVSPVLVSLLVIDLQTLLLKVTPILVISYLIKILALFALGGLIGWLHKNEHELFKLFQLGIAAPALITAGINGTRIPLPEAVPVTTTRASFSLVGEAYAQPAQHPTTKQFSYPQETANQQIARGLFGKLPENVWFVIVGSHLAQESANKQAEELRIRGFSADIYLPYGGNPFYAVVIGAQMTRSDAQALQQKAIAAGLPKDTYLWTFPRQ
jgi:SPOR domain